MKTYYGTASHKWIGVAAALVALIATAPIGQAVTFTETVIIQDSFPEIRFDQPSGNDPSIEVSSTGRLEIENTNGSQVMSAELSTGRIIFGNTTALPDRAYHFRPTFDGADASILVDNENQAMVAPRNMFELLNNGAPRFVLRDNSFTPDRLFTFALNPQGNFTMTRAGVAGVEFILYNNNGNIEMGPGTSTTFRVTAGGVQATNYGMLSDREAKKDIEELTSEEVLSKIKEVPVSTWRFKGEEDSGLHIGPMAQDFREAFGTGTSNRIINMGDLAGVALAGVRSLSHELEARDAEVKELRERLEKAQTRSSELEERISRLEKLLKNKM